MMLIGIGIIFFLVGGVVFKIFPPKKINHVYGWRTSFAMKNQDTWDYAQSIGANAFMIGGLCLTFIGAINQTFLLWNENVDLIIMLVSTLLIIVAGEMQLRKVFNKDGSRKE